MREAFAPLDQNHCLPIQNLLQAQRRYLLGRVEPVQVNVVSPAPSVFMDQGERRTGYVLRFGDAQSAENPFGERGFARAQIADQEHDCALGKLGGDPAA